ncbi:hypothetical protein D0C36_06195 [Mucilaginibacter conchicola]|uniref:PorT family protein n=1 Tax=Mucilaginibacter conchicola TaxID=2303333 RepID=A0A372NYD0_9SPHI|nr:DUF6588 family protein [Mucilaginibacter conchicola]RFZ95115.1 hypothetical protein D0C36_06195 [Mucilaginibacter conchicola]
MKQIPHFLACLMLTCCALNSKAQSSFADLIKSGPADATKLIDAYSSPLFKGFGIGLNSGWNSTAHTKKPLKFDIRITASGALIPTSDRNFDVSKIGLSNSVRVKPGSPNITPTFGGGNNPTTLEVFDDQNHKIDEFQLPGGKSSIVPAPQIQLTIGLPFNTDVSLRGAPTINVGDEVGKISMYGIGLKHNIMQDFAGPKNKTPFDLSVAFGFSRLNMHVPLNIKPAEGALPAPGTEAADFDTQRVDAHFNSFEIQAIVSKRYGVFIPFASIGYNRTKTYADALGNYPFTTDAIGGVRFYQTFTNPISITKRYLDHARADVGFQLNLGVFRYYASYAFSQYHSINTGIGFGI